MAIASSPMACAREPQRGTQRSSGGTSASTCGGTDVDYIDYIDNIDYIDYIDYEKWDDDERNTRTLSPLFPDNDTGIPRARARDADDGPLLVFRLGEYFDSLKASRSTGSTSTALAPWDGKSNPKSTRTKLDGILPFAAPFRGVDGEGGPEGGPEGDGGVDAIAKAKANAVSDDDETEIIIDDFDVDRDAENIEFDGDIDFYGDFTPPATDSISGPTPKKSC